MSLTTCTHLRGATNACVFHHLLNSLVKVGDVNSFFTGKFSKLFMKNILSEPYRRSFLPWHHGASLQLYPPSGMVKMDPYTTKAGLLLVKPEIDNSVLLSMCGIKIANNILTLDSHSLTGKLTTSCEFMQSWYSYSAVKTSIAIYIHILLIFIDLYCKVLDHGICCQSSDLLGSV